MTLSKNSFNSYAGYYAATVVDQTPTDAAFIRQFYRMLHSYYQQNGLYDYISSQLSEVSGSDTAPRGLRNPAWRVVEFYASKIWPGTLPDALKIESENPALDAAIRRVWFWSNFESVKQRWSRWFGIYGDWFLKVNTKVRDGEAASVYLSIIKPEYVTDFSLDERGFLTWIRLDVPIGHDDSGIEHFYTEVWDKGTGFVTVWQDHKSGLDADLANMGSPTTEMTFEESHGENFIPIVYQPFRDDGMGRGGGAFTAQLDKIDETNRQATRIAQMLFRYNRALWVVTTEGADRQGRPRLPVGVEGMLNADSQVEISDDDILSLPGMSDLKALVPPVNFADALDILEAQMSELSKDLPELTYYELREMGELSGRAVRFLLDDMISRVIEVRGNAEAALIRANKMAITIGQNMGLFDEQIGGFEEGALEHSFLERPVLPPDDLQTAQIVQLYAGSGASLYAAGKTAGMSDEEATELAQVDLFGLEGLSEPLGSQAPGVEGIRPVDEESTASGEVLAEVDNA